MAANSDIEWTDATWNVVTGCSVVSPGCTNCYAMRLAGTRLQHIPSRVGLTTPTKAGPVWNGQVRFNREWLTQPLSWKTPKKVFVCAHGDLFAEGVEDAWLDLIFAVMALTPQHTYQVLTKRPERAKAYIDANRTNGCGLDRALGGPLLKQWEKARRARVNMPPFAMPLPNVWLGVSAEDQRRADERVPVLLDTPAAVRFVSLEPLLGPIDLARLEVAPPRGGDDDQWGCNALTGRTAPIIMFGNMATRDGWALDGGGRLGSRLDWAIVGGESGPGARPMHPDWARAIRDDCDDAGVPFFFKQWGAWAPVCAMTDEQNEAAYHPRPPRDPEASRRCRVATHVLHTDGSRHGLTEPRAYVGGVGAMMMMEIGKKAAGRLLDGVEHNMMPGAGLG